MALIPDLFPLTGLGPCPDFWYLTTFSLNFQEKSYSTAFSQTDTVHTVRLGGVLTFDELIAPVR